MFKVACGNVSDRCAVGKAFASNGWRLGPAKSMLPAARNNSNSIERWWAVLFQETDNQ